MLRNILNDAMRDGRVARNAAELAKSLPLDDVSRRVILKPEHFPAFVEMCERHDMGALWMLALGAARRESELLGLRWTDVAWERGEVPVASDPAAVSTRPGGQVLAEQWRLPPPAARSRASAPAPRR